MASNNMGVVACRNGGYAVFDYGDNTVEDELPVAAFLTLLDALLFIERQMSPAEPRNGLLVHKGGKLETPSSG